MVKEAFPGDQFSEAILPRERGRAKLGVGGAQTVVADMSGWVE